MANYKRIDKGTIEAKVGERFSIECNSAAHIEGRLSYPEVAIELVGKRTKPMKNFGPRAPIVYSFKGLTPGSYEIEYQRLQPPFYENPGQVTDADVYKVNIFQRK